jgi:hypothetical protein
MREKNAYNGCCVVGLLYRIRLQDLYERAIYAYAGAAKLLSVEYVDRYAG